MRNNIDSVHFLTQVCWKMCRPKSAHLHTKPQSPICAQIWSPGPSPANVLPSLLSSQCFGGEANKWDKQKLHYRAAEGRGHRGGANRRQLRTQQWPKQPMEGSRQLMMWWWWPPFPPIINQEDVCRDCNIPQRLKKCFKAFNTSKIMINKKKTYWCLSEYTKSIYQNQWMVHLQV